MKKLKLLIAMMIVSPLYAADNEIYIDQSGNTANIDLEQLGSGNIIGGLLSSAGSINPLDLDGISLTLDINQLGDTNKFLGDIYGDSVTGLFEFDGDGNTFTIQADPTDTYGNHGHSQSDERRIDRESSRQHRPPPDPRRIGLRRS